MNNQTVYWLWIQQALGYASHYIDMITESYTFAEDFYRASLSEKMRAGGFVRSIGDRLADTSLEKAQQIMEKCVNSNIEIVSYGDSAYPELLRNIKAPPAVLFVRGDINVLSSSLNVAVIGTRSASEFGRRFAFKLSRDLARRGICIVSGGARGIDTQAHLGALNANGKTICVLGCGHNYGYLQENETMRRNILFRGAVISEYPPDASASKFTFPQRNRIISGLSKGVAVVEAGKRSGSLITVRNALDQGRDVFAVPGSVENPKSDGTNLLIKDGAIVLTCADDIISEYMGVGVYFENDDNDKTAGESKLASSENTMQSETQLSDDSDMLPENDDNDKTAGESKLASSENTMQSETQLSDDSDMLPENDAHDYSKYLNGDQITQPKRETILEKYKEAVNQIRRDQQDDSALRVGSVPASQNNGAKTRGNVNSKSAKSEPAVFQPSYHDRKQRYDFDLSDNTAFSTTDATKVQKPQELSEIPDNSDVSENAKKFLKALGNQTLHIDVIAERSGLMISAAAAAATELELCDLIESLQGRLYRAKR